MKYRIIGIDVQTGEHRRLRIEAADEKGAWQRAEQQGIKPLEIAAKPSSKKPRRNHQENGSGSRQGVVYLMKMRDRFKIGKTTTPSQRYSVIKLQLPDKGAVIHHIKTNDVDYVEAHWHKRFQSQRTNGEWFDLSDTDMEEFIRCKRMIVRSF